MSKELKTTAKPPQPAKTAKPVETADTPQPAKTPAEAPQASKKALYLTTAIPYVNGVPHLGHAMDYLLADIYTRYQRLQGHTVRFSAGTDEHGSKIYRKATESGQDVQAYVDANAARFQRFIGSLGVEHTDFIRTSSPDHVRRVQQIWQRLAPHIYSSTYQGWYCEGCESFVTDTEYKDNHGTCPDHQTRYQRLEEKNYYLRIADFKDQIQEAIEGGRLQILPDFRRKEALKLLEDTPDVSISRPREHLPWGIPVPGDDSQVMYVWMDALTNYITVLGYPEQDISAAWPADLQIVGKDILRFHAIIWPAILLGLGLELPRAILSHGFVLVNGQKMSKSIGNVVSPTEVLDRHGLPAFRYFFSRHADTFLDCDFSWTKFESAYNHELANELGNLVQRLANLCHKAGLPGQSVDIPAEMNADAAYTEQMQALYFSRAMDVAWERVQAINKRIDDTKPWQLPKLGRAAELPELLASLVQDLLHVAALLAPFLPDTSQQIIQLFTAEQITLPPAPLFPKAH